MILSHFGAVLGPRGYLNGPRVVQHGIYSCNIPMGSVLGSFGAFQDNIWSVAPFIPAWDQNHKIGRREKFLVGVREKTYIII